MTQKKISHMVIMGDSLSDSGTADKAYVLGCIPMALLSGLSGTSPRGRFTNGYVWADVISSMFASDFLIKQLKKKYHCSNDDIADAVISKSKWVMDSLQYSYKLDNNLYVKYDGRDFIRSYDEGGLSAHDYSWWPSSNITRFFSRIILSTLAAKRKELLDYDDKNHLTRKQKAHTLVVEWSGANDLITVNAQPSIAEVDRAIKERVKNAELLIKNGYRHIVLFNLPDLALTPRFQHKTEVERKNAGECSRYFNEQLQEAVKKLQTVYVHCTLDVFDINATFSKVYNNPEAYGFETAKRNEPYKTSPDFSIEPNKTSPAKGYMFWDDVHPTADLHALLANEFYKKYNREYRFSEPEPEGQPEAKIHISEAQLKRAFCTRYAETLNRDRHGLFSYLRSSNLRYQSASLEDILRHALCENGKRTHEVITGLQWIDAAGKVNLNIEPLHNAMLNLKLSLERKTPEKMA